MQNAAKHLAPVYSIEVICSDAAEFASRLRTRPGSWQRVVARMSKSYEPAPGALDVDSRNHVEEMVEDAVEFVGPGGRIAQADTCVTVTDAQPRSPAPRIRV
jgi:hypothetical protein